jgi:hypothetical protein
MVRPCRDRVKVRTPAGSGGTADEVLLADERIPPVPNRRGGLGHGEGHVRGYGDGGHRLDHRHRSIVRHRERAAAVAPTASSPSWTTFTVELVKTPSTRLLQYANH